MGDLTTENGANFTDCNVKIANERVIRLCVDLLTLATAFFIVVEKNYQQDYIVITLVVKILTVNYHTVVLAFINVLYPLSIR